MVQAGITVMAKMTSQQGFLSPEAVERSTDRAKAEYEAEGKRVKGEYVREARRDLLRRVLESFNNRKRPLSKP